MSIEGVVHRSSMISLLVIVGIVVAAGAMYAVKGNAGGFIGVPRLLPDDFAQGKSGDILNIVAYVLLMAGIFGLLAVVVYKLRGLKD